MSDLVARLLGFFDLEVLGDDHYRGASPGGTRRRLFGGHVAAQALMAAFRSVAAAPAHSLHAYFLRPGDPHEPIEYRVRRLRDGRSYSARLVEASQRGELILHASISFHAPEGGEIAHQIDPPVVPPPAACISWEEWAAPRLARMSESQRLQMVRERPIELRPIDPVDPISGEPSGFSQRFWLRALGRLPADDRLHQVVAVYASDHTLLGCALRPHGLTFMSAGVRAASLDHAIWFHRAFRMDEWLVYDQQSPAAFAGRGLSLGHFFDAQGNLVASMAQEGVLRRR
jgi:acyl-CoA thioesterase-2